MPTPRALVLAALLCAVPAPAYAHPGHRHPVPPAACNLVKDPPGDVDNSLQGAPVFPADGGLDIVGGDVASNTRAITAVIRLAAPPGDATAYAKRFIAQFTVAGQKYPMLLAAAVTPTGVTYSAGWYGPNAAGDDGYNYSSTATATGTITDKVIKVSAPLSGVAAEANLGAIRPNAKISAFEFTANRRVPAVTAAPGTVFTADEATGRTPYYAGGRSCITV